MLLHTTFLISTDNPRVTSLTVSPAPILSSGTTFTIVCSVSHAPAPFSIRWYQNGTLIPPADSRFQMVAGEDSGTLTVYNPDQSYSAVYTCNVTTEHAFDTAQATVTVGCKIIVVCTLKRSKKPKTSLCSISYCKDHYEPKKLACMKSRKNYSVIFVGVVLVKQKFGDFVFSAAPVIDKTSSDTDLKPGEGAFLDCAVIGLPNPRIDWFMRNETGGIRQLVATVGEHYVVHTESLQLVNATQQESGVYECRAMNELGTYNKTATVRVEGEFHATH